MNVYRCDDYYEEDDFETINCNISEFAVIMKEKLFQKLSFACKCVFKSFNRPVQDFCTYFAGENCVLVHNRCKPQPPDKITGYTKHGIESAMNHDGVGIKPSAILDTFRNPISMTFDPVRGTFKYVGHQATLILNPAGKVITTYAKSSLYWRAP